MTENTVVRFRGWGGVRADRVMFRLEEGAWSYRSRAGSGVISMDQIIQGKFSSCSVFFWVGVWGGVRRGCPTEDDCGP